MRDSHTFIPQSLDEKKKTQQKSVSNQYLTHYPIIPPKSPQRCANKWNVINKSFQAMGLTSISPQISAPIGFTHDEM